MKRIERGTWMGHVVEHIALELQILAGFDVGFGRARGAGTEGHYYIVFDCVDEESGRLTAEKAVSIAQQLVDGNIIDVAPYVEEIKKVSFQCRPGPSTSSLLHEAAARDIPYIKLEDSTYQLGYGCFQKKIAATIVSTTSSLAVELAGDKQACRRLFKEMAIPVAEGSVAFSREELVDLTDEMGFPLVIKPISGNQGRGVITHITTTNSAQGAAGHFYYVMR